MRRFLESLSYAWRGIRLAWPEPNFKIELVIGALTAVGAAIYRITGPSLAVLVIATGLVLAEEVSNTRIEKWCDLIKPRNEGEDPNIRDIKDTAAGTVLTKAIMAAIVGVIVFGPHVAHTITQVF